MNSKVSKRIVFFLGGFDPRGGRHYYSSFKQEAAKMADLGGGSIEVSERKRVGKWITQWNVAYGDEGVEQKVETEFRSLNYDDIIRRFWLKSEASLLRKMFYTYFILWKNSFFKNRWRVVKPMVYIGGFIVILFFCLALILAALTISIWSVESLSEYWKWGLFFLSVIALWQVGRVVDKKFNHYWLIRGICFSGLQEQYGDPEYQERMNFFADQVKTADEGGDYDEIVVAGHSSGAIWASEVLARALQADPQLGERKASVALLTLGSTIPLMAANRRDRGYHQYLKTLAYATQIDWLDLSERWDNAGFYFVDPVALLKDEEEDETGKRLPRLRRAKFFQLFEEAEFRKFKRDGYRVHFQFLYASPQSGEYDYFRMTCGPDPIREQYVV